MRVSLALVLMAFVGLAALYYSVPFAPESLVLPESDVWLDRTGRIIRIAPGERGERHLHAPLPEIPVLLQEAFIAAEDKRFHNHPGFDLIAIARAFWTNIRYGEIKSGASTLTQQLVRLSYPRPRTYASKAIEIIRAVKAERSLSKEEILERYLNRVPMGNNIVGVKLAAKVYFNKPLDQLSPSECALLAALPKSPSRLNPYRRDKDRLLTRRNWVLRRMGELESLSPQDLETSLSAAITLAPRRFPSSAPHLVDALDKRIRIGRIERPQELNTTVEAHLQREVEEILRSHRSRLLEKGAHQAAAMVVRNRSAEVVALAGSFEYSSRDLGYNNGALSARSPGSLLKPFLYSLALESGYPASTLLEDTQRDYKSRQGEYLPRNYDRRQYGPVTLRPALGNSLNLSAVRMLNLLGYRSFHQMLSGIGLLNDADKGEDHYGLGLAIGNPEMTLEELVTAYVMLANGGEYRSLRYFMSDPLEEPMTVLSPQAAFIITDVLADPNARSLTFASTTLADCHYRIAWKTGTSTRYRDGWMIGYTPEYTVGVWTGNFDGAPTDNMSGSASAGPVFADLMRSLNRGGSTEWYTPPRDIVRQEICGYSGMKPSRWCTHRRQEWFMAGVVPNEVCTFHRQPDTRPELASSYAPWLYEQAAKGVIPAYEMEGPAGSTMTNLDDPWKVFKSGDGTTVIRVHGEIEGETVQAPDGVEPVQQHVSIGGDAPVITIPSVHSRDPIRIEYPLNGDRFLTGQGMGSEGGLRLQARVEIPAQAVTWYIDGVQYARVGPPYQIVWRMTPGRHRIAAVTSDGIGDEVSITVE